MIRREILNLAHILSMDSGINEMALYYFLMDVGRDKGKNPKFLAWRVSKGRVALCDGTSYIETYHAN